MSRSTEKTTGAGFVAAGASPTERVRNGLSRALPRWASLRRVERPSRPSRTGAIARFIAELLEAASLIRNLDSQRRSVATAWGLLVRLRPDAGLQPDRGADQPDWRQTRVGLGLFANCGPALHAPTLSGTSPPARGARDPLDEYARAECLGAADVAVAARSHLIPAVTAASAAGIDVARWRSLASLVEPPRPSRRCCGTCGRRGGRQAHRLHALASPRHALVAIAAEWVEPPADAVAKKSRQALRRKLGTLPSGSTDKNKALVRKFDNPRLVESAAEFAGSSCGGGRAEIWRPRAAAVH